MSEEMNKENALQNAILTKSEGDTSSEPYVPNIENANKSKYKKKIIK